MVTTFKLVSEFITIGTRPFEFDDPSIINPMAVNPLIMGEFLELTQDTYKMKRGTVNPAVVPSFCYFAQQGAYDVQGLGKGPFLYMQQYEADTMLFTLGALAVGDALEVNNVTYGTLTVRGLQKATGGYVVGHVTRLPVYNGGFLRFLRSLN